MPRDPSFTIRLPLELIEHLEKIAVREGLIDKKRHSRSAAVRWLIAKDLKRTPKKNLPLSLDSGR